MPDISQDRSFLLMDVLSCKKEVVDHMFLNIDKHNKQSVALIDNYGNKATYGELIEIMKAIGSKVEQRSIIFILCNVISKLVKFTLPKPLLFTYHQKINFRTSTQYKY